MKVVHSKAFQPDRAWGAMDIAEMNGISVRLHWTDQPYRWHINDGEEVFAVLHGIVDMHVREAGGVRVFPLEAGDLFYADTGCEHVAHPRGQAHILVIEKNGSA